MDGQALAGKCQEASGLLLLQANKHPQARVQRHMRKSIGAPKVWGAPLWQGSWSLCGDGLEQKAGSTVW